MIKIEKYINIYEKGDLIRSEKVETMQAANEETAKEIIKNYKLNYVKNQKGTCIFESVTTPLIKKDNSNYIQYYKNINYNTCKEWGNF